MKKKNLFVSIVILVILFLGYWFFIRPNITDRGPTNPPTAEELERIQKIDESSSQIAPNAVPGAGVRPVGSLPRTPEPVSESTTSTSTEIIE